MNAEPAASPYARGTPDGVLLALKVQPRASRDELAGVHGGELKVRVTAPPVDSAANEAVVRFLAGVLDCPRSAVTLVRGSAARHKTVRVAGLPLSTVVERLQAAGG